MFGPQHLDDPFLGIKPNWPQPAQEEPKQEWLVGLDLGQAVDFTAMVILSRTQKKEGRETVHEYDCPSIHRWPLGTTYPAIVEDLKVKLAKLPDKPTLIVDGTGCGRPVVDMIERASLPIAHLVPTLITSGALAGWSEGYRTVPKRDLVGAVMAIMHREQLHIAKELPETQTLVKELRAFTAKITTAGSEKYENDWRVAPHDDIILALALALEYDRSLKEFTADMVYLG